MRPALKMFLVVSALVAVRAVFASVKTSSHFLETLLPAVLLAIGAIFFRNKDIDERRLPGRWFAFALPAIFLVSLGIFSLGPIIITDYPIHLQRIEKFSGVFYYDPSFGAGTVDSFVQPPGAFSLAAALSKASGIGSPEIMRILAVLSFALASLGVGFFALEGLGTGEKFSALSVIAWTAFPHDEFVHGTYSTYLALALALIASGLLFRSLREEGRISAIAPVLYATALLCHILSALAVFVPVFAVSLLMYRGKISERGFAQFAFFSVFPSLFWLVPSLASSAAYDFLNVFKLYPFYSSPVEIFFRRFVLRNPEFFIIPLAALAFSAGYRRKALLPLALLVASLGTAALSFVPGMLFPKLFAQLVSDRFLMAARAFAICAFAYCLFILRKRAGAAVLLAAFLAPVAFYSVVSPVSFLGNDGAFSLLHGGGNFQAWFGTEMDGPLFSRKVPEELLESSFWAGANLKSRVFFDDESGPSFGGHPAPLFQRYSGLELIGGPIATATYWGADTQIYDGVVFGKRISEYTREEFSDTSGGLGISAALSKTGPTESALKGMGFPEVARFRQISVFFLEPKQPLPRPLKEFPLFKQSSEGDPDTKLFLPDGEADGLPKYSPPIHLKVLEILSLVSFPLALVLGARQEPEKKGSSPAK